MPEILSGCQEAILLAVTLGPQIEQLLMRREVTDMADALIMDACASAAIENVCDHFEFDLREQLKREGKFLTDRFSPGYGDLPLHTQRRLCEALNTARRIGLTRHTELFDDSAEICHGNSGNLRSSAKTEKTGL